MDVESKLRNLEERLNKPVTPKNTLSQEQQDILRREKEQFMDPMELRMRRRNDYGGRRTRRRRNNSRRYKNKK